MHVSKVALVVSVWGTQQIREGIGSTAVDRAGSTGIEAEIRAVYHSGSTGLGAESKADRRGGSELHLGRVWGSFVVCLPKRLDPAIIGHFFRDH